MAAPIRDMVGAAQRVVARTMSRQDVQATKIFTDSYKIVHNARYSMAVKLAGIYTDGCEFTIPVGTMVNPVYRRPNGSIYAEGGVRTIRESLHATYRLLPTDGRFRTFIERNTKNGTAFAIALFEKPVRTNRGVAIGCVVDLKMTERDLPF